VVARLEDGLTWLPSVMVLTLALMSGRPQHVWRLCRRDAIKDPSPNSGWVRCAYAVLGVQMGGTNWYGGVAKHKPLLGDPIHPITAARIHGAAANSVLLLIWLGWRFAACPFFYRVAFNKFARWGGNIKQNRQVDEQGLIPGYC